MKHVPTLVLGATFAGLGIASAAKQRALVIDSFSQPGHEFISSFRLGEHWPAAARTSQGGQLLGQLKQRNVLNEAGFVHLPAVLPIVCDYIERERLPLLLMTSVVHIAPHPQGYEVTVHNVSGRQTLIAGELIDTTSQSLAFAGIAPSIRRKRLNAMLHHPEPDGRLPEPFAESISFQQGRFAGEVVLRVELAPDDGWIEARQKLYRLWSERPEQLAPWKIAAIADTFELHPGTGPDRLGENWLHLPSAAYSNPIEAFEEGVLLAERRGGTR